jgi:translation initiation factor 3 subunit A
MNRGGGFRGGGGGFTRPENALKRADELIAVGQPAAALQILSDVATSKKHRTWTQNHEQIMLKLVDLCVEARKRNQLKEALMQYRNVTQGVNIGSLELVVRHLLETATKRAEDACAQAEAQAAAEEAAETSAAKTADEASAAALAAVGDLEADASPEDIMLSYVSGDKSKDRTDRELVTPWFRFLWESYRSVLEILRTNPKLESLYASAARHAFAFCLKYKRTAEFRRLCDVLRQHLANMARYRDARELTAPEPLNLHLETRFEQLRVACELGLWAEAFRSVEDIQALLALGGAAPGGGALPGAKVPPGGRIAAPRPALMSVYYARLTQIFQVSEAHLYQAFAWLKLFTFSRAHRAKDLAADDARALATSVALATLSVLPYERQLFVGRPADEQAAEQERERALRIANILGLNVDAALMGGKRGGAGAAGAGASATPTDPRTLLSRGQLLASVQALNVLSLVPPEVRAAYDLLTSDDASPLDLCSQLQPLLEQIQALSVATSPACPVSSPDFGAYVKHLRDVAVVRTLKQLSSLYSAMRVADLAALVAPVQPDFGCVEALAADAVRSGYLQARVDHRRGTVSFGSASLDSDGLRAHLAELARRLSRAALLIDPQEGARPRNAEERRLAAVRQAREQVEGEHKRALARKQVIEKRKEQQEAALLEQEREEERRRLQAAREQELLEEKRRKEEAARREKERLERELEEQEMAEARQLLEQAAAKKRLMGGKSAAAALRAGLPGGDAGDDGVKLDKKALMQEALSERLREAQELERKIARAAKTMDHLERARREEEAPLIEAAYAARAEEDAALHAEQQAQLLEAHRQAWEADVKEKARLAAMADEKEAFAAAIVAKRQEQFEALREEKARRLEERRAALKIEREVARRREFVTRCRKDVEARLAELEAERKAQEDARRKAELAERQKKLEEAAAKQRAREEEIEARARAEKEAVLAGRVPSAGAGGAAAAAGGAPRASGAFVPPALRRAQEGGGGSGAAPAAAASAGPAAPRPSGGAAFVPPALRRQQEAAAAGGGAPPPAAERPAAAAAAPAAPAAAPAAPAAGGGGGGKFVPSALRRLQQPPADESGGGGARRW